LQFFAGPTSSDWDLSRWKVSVNFWISILTILHKKSHLLCLVVRPSGALHAAWREVWWQVTHTDYPDWGLHHCSQPLQANGVIVPQVGPRLIHSTQFAIRQWAYSTLNNLSSIKLTINR
jgi:hypothetical protein